MKTNLVLIAILLLSSLLRFYNITKVPPNLNWDEVAIGYNAFSINETGKDEWGNKYPVLFKSFGDYKPPVYIYSVALAEKLFGQTDFSVRLPSALAGIFTTCVVFLLVRELFNSSKKKTKLALMAAFLFAVSPWALQFNRAGFEASLALFLVTTGVYFFLLALKEKIIWLLPSLIFFSLATATYHNARIFVPLFVGVLFLLNFRYLWKKILPIALILIFVFILNIPYLGTWVSNEGRARFVSESVINQPGNLVENLQTNYLGNFSSDYLFFRGDQNGRHSVKKLGQNYLWELPFFLFGAYILIKKRNKASWLIISWLLLAAIPPTMTKVSPHALRGLLMVIPILTITALGLVTINRKKLLTVIVLPIFLFFFVLYLHTYFEHYPKAYALDWQDGSKQAVEDLTKLSPSYDQIFVHPSLDPTFILFYNSYPPEKLYEKHHVTKNLGKFYYHDLNTQPIKKNPTKKSLILAPATTTPGNSKQLEEIDMTNGEAIFKIYEF